MKFLKINLFIHGKTKSNPQEESPQKIPQKHTIPKFSGEGFYRFVNTGTAGGWLALKSRQSLLPLLNRFRPPSRPLQKAPLLRFIPQKRSQR